eukprot:m.410395 g.410395  ORF g.410395 m.410395 type:complete len:158 (-) comp16810_c0_seq5:51-524(-)
MALTQAMIKELEKAGAAIEVDSDGGRTLCLVSPESASRFKELLKTSPLHKPIHVLVSFSMHPFDVQQNIARLLQTYQKWNGQREVNVLEHPEGGRVHGGVFRFETGLGLARLAEVLQSPPESCKALCDAVTALPDGGCICGFGIVIKPSCVSWTIAK